MIVIHNAACTLVLLAVTATSLAAAEKTTDKHSQPYTEAVLRVEGMI